MVNVSSTGLTVPTSPDALDTHQPPDSFSVSYLVLDPYLILILPVVLLAGGEDTLDTIPSSELKQKTISLDEFLPHLWTIAQGIIQILAL